MGYISWQDLRKQLVVVVCHLPLSFHLRKGNLGLSLTAMNDKKQEPLHSEGEKLILSKWSFEFWFIIAIKHYYHKTSPFHQGL